MDNYKEEYEKLLHKTKLKEFNDLIKKCDNAIENLDSWVKFTKEFPFLRDHHANDMIDTRNNILNVFCDLTEKLKHEMFGDLYDNEQKS